VQTTDELSTTTSGTERKCVFVDDVARAAVLKHISMDDVVRAAGLKHISLNNVARAAGLEGLFD
jgi:adenine deaminase